MKLHKMKTLAGAVAFVDVIHRRFRVCWVYGHTGKQLGTLQYL
jgi:hypothetical protein